MHIENALFPTPAQAQAFFSDESGPVVMVNLLSFREKAAYPDGSEPELSGREAYMRYGEAVTGCLAEVGGQALSAGAVGGLLVGAADAMWDMVALALYPSPRAMAAMVALPSYQAIEHHRLAGLAGQLNIITRPMDLAALQAAGQ